MGQSQHGWECGIRKRGQLIAENAALREIVSRISAAAIDPAVERAERLDLIQSILIGWLRSKQR
jgi:hypothetical protein